MENNLNNWVTNPDEYKWLLWFVLLLLLTDRKTILADMRCAAMHRPICPSAAQTPLSAVQMDPNGPRRRPPHDIDVLRTTALDDVILDEDWWNRRDHRAMAHGCVHGSPPCLLSHTDVPSSCSAHRFRLVQNSVKKWEIRNFLIKFHLSRIRRHPKNTASVLCWGSALISNCDRLKTKQPSPTTMPNK